MAIVKQIRYFEDSNSNNFPSGLTEENFNSKLTEIFQGTIKKFGIQTLPGVTFIVNPKDEADDGQGIIIGPSGIYDLDLEKIGIQIENIQFTGSSLSLIKNNPSAYLIIDLIKE